MKTYQNPVKVALKYREILDLGQADSQADLSRILGVSRAKVTQMLNLLKLDEEILEFMLSLEPTDGKLQMLTERKLRLLAKLSGNIQKERFGELLEKGGIGRNAFDS